MDVRVQKKQNDEQRRKLRRRGRRAGLLSEKKRSMWRHEVLREEEGFLKEGFLLAAEDSMSSGFGHQTPTGRCFPVFMVRRPGLERQRSCSRDFQR
jgi:hypothetical protein